MARFIYKGISLDEETAQMLKAIASHTANGETPNESRSIRQMIREKAEQLRIEVEPAERKPLQPKPV